MCKRLTVCLKDLPNAYGTTARWGIYISQAGALEPTIQSNAHPCLTVRDSVLHSLALGPPGLFLSPLSPVWGRGHLCGVQLAFLISRCQELENDLAHQLVGTQQTRESLYGRLQAPAPETGHSETG